MNEVTKTVKDVSHTVDELMDRIDYEIRGFLLDKTADQLFYFGAARRELKIHLQKQSV